MTSLFGRGLPRLWSKPPAPRLVGERVEIRPPEPDDWRAWSELRRESRGFLTPWEPSWPADALTESAFRRRVRQYARERDARVGYAFLILHRRDRHLLGGVSLSNLRRGVAQSASLGYWIGLRHARRGYMTEALALLLDWSFDALALHRLEAACLPENQPSRGLLEKLGFRQEGVARGYLKIDGRWQDHVLYGLLAEDWRARRHAARPDETIGAPATSSGPEFAAAARSALPSDGGDS